MTHISEYDQVPKKGGMALGGCVGASLLVAAMLYLVFWHTPIESEANLFQRLVYLWVPAVWVSGLAFVLVMFASVGYLVTNQKIWQSRASAMAEIGLLFCSVTIVAGVVRIKATTGGWWHADIVLAMMGVLWGILVIYLGLRHYAATPHSCKWLAGFDLLACFSIPIVFVRFERVLPAQMTAVVVRQYAEAEWNVLMTLLVSLLALFSLFWYLVHHRVAIDVMQEELEEIRKTFVGQHWPTTDLRVENQNFVIEGYSFTENQHHE